MHSHTNDLGISAAARIAIGLVMRNAGFRGPTRRIGLRMGQDLAAAHPAKGSGLNAAVAAFSDACHAVGFVRCKSLQASLSRQCYVRFTACEEALGYKVFAANRAVCSFDEGLMEAYLNHVLKRSDITVNETACLGKGDEFCEFVVRE